MTSVTTCGGCTTGTYQTGLGATKCSICQKGTYNSQTASQTSSACVVCPLGYYCKDDGLSSPTACAAGHYLPTTGGTSASDCQGCPQGTYLDTTSGTSPSDCQTCALGTYSLSTGLSSPCPVCQAGYFCPTTTEQSPCPAHTTSENGSFSLLRCHCVSGRICVYAKRIHMVVTLNVSMSDFQADVASVQTNFLQALHDASGIQEEHHPIESTINNIMLAGPSRRRLLEDTDEIIDVYATVSGVGQLKNLKHHLTARIAEVHVAHTLKYDHSVHVLP